MIASAKLGSPELWDAYFDKVWHLSLEKMNPIDLNMISQTLQHVKSSCSDDIQLRFLAELLLRIETRQKKIEE